jgi:hypothetical protein
LNEWSVEENRKKLNLFGNLEILVTAVVNRKVPSLTLTSRRNTSQILAISWEINLMLSKLILYNLCYSLIRIEIDGNHNNVKINRHKNIL